MGARRVLGGELLKKLRWGVLSTANIGRGAVIPAIQASSNGELVGVASRDLDRARAFAEGSKIPRHYGSYEALLDDPDIDAVYIPLPSGLHKEWSIRAAEKKKHVLCEKPLGLNARECREMQDAADAHGVKLMEAFMYRFHPRTGRIVEMVRDGLFGPTRVIRSAFTFRLTRPDNIRLVPALGGGALMDVGCYCVNVSRTLAGKEPVEAQAWARWGQTGVDLWLQGTLRFDENLFAHFDCGMDMERREVFEVAGTDANATVEAAYLPGTGPVPIVEHRGRTHTSHEIQGADEYQLMVEHFAECAQGGGTLRYSALEAAANMAAIEALYASARKGGVPVSVAPVTA
jgi:predicted dehydrogenase